MIYFICWAVFLTVLILATIVTAVMGNRGTGRKASSAQDEIDAEEEFGDEPMGEPEMEAESFAESEPAEFAEAPADDFAEFENEFK
ncbi:hypothetical protein [Neorhodopirellula pilleata]|uniref:Uncharacterized protein n=1 Tax=Neorhodopirellula pilleata TaxID=2714738 RepID=A0A5C6AX61_9BACT|nr:hypothetical protein [Neorhodopirellula pilleata]TWU03622.1 hypothetical protein Pla100_05510 [Neorhodopirellula pilleata]